MAHRVVNASFATPPGWASGHLQTVRSRAVPRRYDLNRYGSRREVLVPVDDGTGDRLSVQLHRARRMPDTRPRGLVVLIHGLGGSAESSYVRATAQGLLKAGFNAARVDLRSAGRSCETSAQMYHAGKTEDLRAVLRHLADAPEASDGGRTTPRLAVMGFSLGGAATLKLLGEPPLDSARGSVDSGRGPLDSARGSVDSARGSLDEGLPVFAGVAVSAPLDLVVGSAHLSNQMFGWYERYIVRALRRDSLRPAPGGAPRVTERELAGIRRARTLPDFDDVVTAPRNGWRDAMEYYTLNSCLPYLSRITLPTLVIHALDDPLIPAQPYLTVDWRSLEAAGAVRRAITARGGHVGFHERGKAQPWYVGQAVSFLSELD